MRAGLTSERTAGPDEIEQHGATWAKISSAPRSGKLMSEVRGVRENQCSDWAYQLTPPPGSTLFQGHENNHDSDETSLAGRFQVEQGGEFGGWLCIQFKNSRGDNTQRTFGANQQMA